LINFPVVTTYVLRGVKMDSNSRVNLKLSLFGAVLT